jgi:hypothetical protein
VYSSGDFKIVKTNALITVAKLMLEVGGKGTINVGDSDITLSVPATTSTEALSKKLNSSTLYEINNIDNYFGVNVSGVSKSAGIDITGPVTFELIKSTA